MSTKNKYTSSPRKYSDRSIPRNKVLQMSVGIRSCMILMGNRELYSALDYEKRLVLSFEAHMLRALYHGQQNDECISSVFQMLQHFSSKEEPPAKKFFFLNVFITLYLLTVDSWLIESFGKNSQGRSLKGGEGEALRYVREKKQSKDNENY